MAGGIKTGVLSRITGQLGSTVDKAKNWLQKAQQTKQQMGSAAQAKNRLKPSAYVSPNASAEAIARRKYAESLKPAEDAARKSREILNTSLQNKSASKSLNKGAAANNYKYAQNLENKDISPLWNKPTANRYGQVQSNKVADSLANQQSLRLRYTKDPRTGKLVGAAYSKLSLLCDL